MTLSRESWKAILRCVVTVPQPIDIGNRISDASIVAAGWVRAKRGAVKVVTIASVQRKSVAVEAEHAQRAG